MILKLHSFSVPVTIDTDLIRAFVWNIELAKIELVLEGGTKRIPIDEELADLETEYQEWGKKRKC